MSLENIVFPTLLYINSLVNLSEFTLEKNKLTQFLKCQSLQLTRNINNVPAIRNCEEEDRALKDGNIGIIINAVQVTLLGTGHATKTDEFSEKFKRGGNFQSKNLCCRFCTFSDIFQKKLQHKGRLKFF